MDFPLDDYHNWLYKTAVDLLPGGFQDPGIDDVVQEGRIAMWKSLEAFDDCKGTLAPWVTNAARMRMRDVVHGHGRPTGHEAVRGSREAEVIAYIDAQDDRPEIAEAVVELAEPILMDVLRELPEEQREYIWLRFWCGVEVSSRAPGIRSAAAQYPVLRKKWVWAKARETLSQDPRILDLVDVMPYR